jgi:hypothetical protein
LGLDKAGKEWSRRALLDKVTDNSQSHQFNKAINLISS